LTQLLTALAILGLTLLLVVPGIIFAVYWAFTQQIATLTDKSGRDAMKYSKELVKGRWWKVVGYSLLF
jgi:uncharacterized membrane protein